MPSWLRCAARRRGMNLGRRRQFGLWDIDIQWAECVTSLSHLRAHADFRSSDAAHHNRPPGWWLLLGQPGRQFQPCVQGRRSRARTCVGPARIE